MNWYAKVLETVYEIDALYKAVRALVVRHPECEAEVGEAFAAVLKALTTKSVTGMLAALSEAQEAYAAFVKAYTDESAANAFADLAAKLKAIAE